MILKRAIINLIRMPVRTLLLSLIVLITVFIICFCDRITDISNYALHELDRTYPFVATAIIKKIPSADGTINNTHRLNLDDAALLLQSDAARSYNFRLAAGSLAEDEIISELPDQRLLVSPPVKEFKQQSCPVYAVNNLYLEQEFLDGTYIICEGTAFTDEDMYGGNRAIILSKSIADFYHLSCGDTVNYKIKNSRVYRSCTIRGIYRERTGEPVFSAYIPLSDYFSDAAIALQGMSRANEQQERDLDAVNRIDILLTSYEDMPQFLFDAKKHGFDFDKNEILINDKTYHTAASGIREIRNISMFVFYLTLAAGVIIVCSLIAFYRHTREKETRILHCLGMRWRDIHAIYLCEYAIIVLWMSAAAIVCGTAASNNVIRHLEQTYIAEIEAHANQKDLVSDVINQYQSSSLSYPVKLRFSEKQESEELHFTEWRYKQPKQSEAVRYETFYDLNSGQALFVKGTNHIAASTEYGEEILYESNRLGGDVFSCHVPNESGYQIGDQIVLCRYAADDLMMMMVDAQETCQYLTPYMAYVILQVTEVCDIDRIEVSFDDLTLISTYLGISSSVYRNIRYDSITDKGDIHE